MFVRGLSAKQRTKVGLSDGGENALRTAEITLSFYRVVQFIKGVRVQRHLSTPTMTHGTSVLSSGRREPTAHSHSLLSPVA